MLARGFEKTARSTFNLLRELLLILAIGALGGQLLIALNGGKPIGTAALAAERLPAQPVLRVVSLELDLDPSDPASVRSITLRVSAPVGEAPERLNISSSPTSSERYSCHSASADSWRCPTPGLRIVDLKQVGVTGS